MRFRVGQGFDFHPLASGRKLVLGGVEIQSDRGLAGHSDADVAVHALAGAILGALGEGDLGRRFPDSDPRYAGISSLKLLSEVGRIADDRRWRLGNADLTIIAQGPRLAPYLDVMRERMAQALKADPRLINVKASSPEGLGSIGRGEGMAASAVVILETD